MLLSNIDVSAAEISQPFGSLAESLPTKNASVSQKCLLPSHINDVKGWLDKEAKGTEIFINPNFSEENIFINNNWTEGRVAAGKRNIFLSDDRPASSPPTLPDHHHDCYWNDGDVDDGGDHPDDVDDDHNNDDGGSFLNL